MCNEYVPRLLVVTRPGKDGKLIKAPYIGDFCVWDIEPAHWTDDVKQAIKHAYELGWRDCNAAHSQVGQVDALGLCFEIGKERKR